MESWTTRLNPYLVILTTTVQVIPQGQIDGLDQSVGCHSVVIWLLSILTFGSGQSHSISSHVTISHWVQIRSDN
jgi:hypothetical protein